MGHPLASAVIVATGLFFGAYISATWHFQRLAAFSQPAPANGTEWDFVVVGSGSSGSPVAARLAEA